MSWEELHGFYEDVHRLVIRRSNPEWLYATGGNGIYHSRDGGASWEHLTTRSMRVGYPDPLLAHPRDEDLMFVAGALSNPFTWRKRGMADPKVARSRDGGRSWEVVDRGLPDHIRGDITVLSMEVCDGSFSLFAGTTDGELFCSDDGGEEWTKILSGLPPITNMNYHFLR